MHITLELVIISASLAEAISLDTTGMAGSLGFVSCPVGGRPGSLHTARREARGSRLGARLSMQGGFGKPTEEAQGMNRDQRRAAKKNEAKNEAAMKKGGAAKGMQKVGEVLSSSLDGKDVAPGAPKKGMALENIKKESLRLREEAIKNAAKKKKEGGPKQIIGLPLEKEVQSIPVELLSSIENTLFIGVFTAGALWILAGLGTAFDAYMIATKQTVPPGVDEALGKYVEPFLTPGLAIILLGSLMLGGLQIYKFEGGRK